MISLIVLSLVFIFIAVRRIGHIRLQIWQVMLMGALAVLVAREIRPETALRAINIDVMLFLFGMFVVGQAMEESGGGYFTRLARTGGNWTVGWAVTALNSDYYWLMLTNTARQDVWCHFTVDVPAG